MTLPNACEKCIPFEGNWTESESGGLKRCDCPRGIALTAAAAPKPRQAPVISPETATMCAEMLATIPFFPGEAGARAAIANEISSMCNSTEQALWLATRMIRLYRKWPGVMDLRLVLCSADQPRDGIEPIGISEFYEDGIPNEKPATPLALAGTPMRQLAAGEPVSAAPSVAAAVSDLAKAKSMSNAGTRMRIREIPINRITDKNRITAADVEAAVREYRTRQVEPLPAPFP